MNAEEIIKLISESEKKTPVKLWVKTKDGTKLKFKGPKSFFGDGSQFVYGEWADIKGVLEESADNIEDMIIENDIRNSAIPLLDLKWLNARVEPGAIIRDGAEIRDGAVVMMGAIINIGAVVGEETMIDMGAVLGGRAITGKRCHVGAGAVLAGVIEPASAKSVVIEDNVLIGANAVVLEGVRVGACAVVAAGAVVIDDVPAGAVVAGAPARVIKMVSETDSDKIGIVDALRAL